MKFRTVHLLITGKVQGVFYRVSAKKAAEHGRITGWVRNTDEGNVEITASGDSAALDAFIAWCRQGPPRASVKEVFIDPQEWKEFSEFTILR